MRKDVMLTNWKGRNDHGVQSLAEVSLQSNRAITDFAHKFPLHVHNEWLPYCLYIQVSL